VPVDLRHLPLPQYHTVDLSHCSSRQVNYHLSPVAILIN